jgi:hypothetical protein
MGHGKGGRRLTTAIGLTATVIALLAGVGIRQRLVPHQAAGALTMPGERPAGVVVAYDFDQGINTDRYGNRFVIDAAGHGHSGSLVTGQASDLTVITHPGHGKAVQFPAPCTPSPTVTCPLAIIESPNAAHLNPGTQNFSYGADVLLQPTETSADSNIMQKGIATGGGSQWKLRIEDTATGIPSCVVIGKGSTVIYKAIADVSVADNTWHNLRCVKTATALAIFIDSINHGQVNLPAGLAVANDSPMRIGGKNVTQNNDNNQFFGALDNVYFHLDKPSHT